MRTAAASEMGSCNERRNNKSTEPAIYSVSSSYKKRSSEHKPSITDDETAEYCPNSSSGSSHSDCSSSGSDELGGGVNVPADRTGLKAPQCDLGEGALWHHSNIALQVDKNMLYVYLQNKTYDKLKKNKD